MAVSILITSAGRRVGLSNAFREAARSLATDLRIAAADLNPELSAACQLADVSYAVPRASHPDYVPALLEICARENVRLLIPTIDHELMPLALAVDQFEAVGVRVNVGSPDFVAVARDKLFTATRLRDAQILTPRTTTQLSTAEGFPGDGPIIVKPRGGSSSIGIKIFQTEVERAGFELPEGYIVQELLSGPEYTVNVFYDQAGNFRTAIPHLRLETRNGEMSKGRTERNAELTEIARKIGASAPGVRGVFCFQAILTGSGAFVFEINARFGGGYPLAHHAGGHFARWLLEEALGMECCASDEWTSDVTALRYDVEVYR